MEKMSMSSSASAGGAAALGSAPVAGLLLRYSLPAIAGMIAVSLYNIVDSIFIGRWVGPDALTALGVAFPLKNVAFAFGMLLGIGGAAVCSIRMGAGDMDGARRVLGNVAVLNVIVGVVFCCAGMLVLDPVLLLFGASAQTLEPARDFMRVFLLSLPIGYSLFNLTHIMRASGYPYRAMCSLILTVICNAAFAPVLIWWLGWGIFGAALATSLGYIVGALMILAYLMQRRHVIRLERIKLSLKSLRLTARNVGYMVRLGLSTFLCEAAIATMMFVGNSVFIRYLGEDGVAAFSIACYFFPIIFMVYNAIAQSAQPILSYNYGASQPARVRSAFRLALWTAVVCGVVAFLVTEFFTEAIVGMFVDTHCPAYRIAVEGLPLFAAGFVCFGVNIVSIGYFQSVERDRPAMAVTLLRGFILVLLCFWLMPVVMGVPGIWLAVPAAETLTLLFVLTIYCRGREKESTCPHE